MAYIPYLDPASIDPAHQVADHDNILQIHGVHGAGLRRLLAAAKVSEDAQDVLLWALEKDHHGADLTPADRAILDYAVKLTLTPRAMSAGDVEGLRAVGLDDSGIHDVCAIVGYFNFVNRMADGLGVELEEGTEG